MLESFKRGLFWTTIRTVSIGCAIAAIPIQSPAWDESAFTSHHGGACELMDPGIKNTIPAIGKRFSVQCKVRVLQNMGFRVDTLASAREAEASSLGTCRTIPVLTLPKNLTANNSTQVNAKLDEALTSPASQCYYSAKFGQAAKLAASRIHANPHYGFSAFGGNSVGNVPGWQKVPCVSGRDCAQVAGDYALAIRSLYSSPMSTECGSGLMIAQYASIFELFGDTQTKQLFTPAEFTVGDWQGIKNSKSVTFGTTGRRYGDCDGLSYAKAGARMFSGVSGYIGNVRGLYTLNALAEQGENFLLLQTSEEGAAAFAKNGGVMGYDRIFKEIYEAAKDLDDQTYLELQKGGYPSWSFQGQYVYRLLSEPFIRDTFVYVHAVGTASIAYHLIRLAHMNPGSEYSLRFYQDAVHGEIFDRYLRAQLEQCDSKTNQ